jgi:cell division protein FtsN
VSEPKLSAEPEAQTVLTAEPPPHGASSETKLDIFWLILAAILVVAVVFVVSVALNAMNNVGSTARSRTRVQSAFATASTDETLVIVQVSSYPTLSAAKATAADLIDRGFHAQVLDSDNYRPMNPNWYVVYTGPYPPTAAGRAEAKRVAARLPDALVREIHAK